MNISMEDGIKLLTKAYESRLNERLEKRWINGGYDREMSFDDFKSELIVHSTNSNKTDEEILLDVKDIIDTFNKGVR